MSFSILEAAREAADVPFLVAPDRTLGFAEVARLCEAEWRAFELQGVKPRSPRPVSVVAHNDLSTVCRMLALLEWRVPMLLLHPRWTEGERDAFLRLGRHTPLEPLQLAPAMYAPGAAPQPGYHEPTGEQADDEERLLAVIPTSGTTQESRGVLLRRGAFDASVRASAQNLPFRSEDRWLLLLPLAHVGGLSILLRCLHQRRTVALSSLDERVRSFEPARVLDCMESLRVTLLSLVPTQLQRLLEVSPRCPPCVRAILLGGAPASSRLKQRARDGGWPILATYGMTEACSQVTTQRLDESGAPGNGRALPGFQVRITSGLIQVRSASLLSGFYPQGEAPLDDGWFTTRDLGRLDPDGTLHVLGRADDVIISGGENVYPSEVEGVLLQHPEVEQACVFGVPDAELGDTVAAVLVTRGGSLPDDLPQHMNGVLAGFKRPRRILVTTELPHTSNGKLDRRAVRRELGARCVSWPPR